MNKINGKRVFNSITEVTGADMSSPSKKMKFDKENVSPGLENKKEIHSNNSEPIKIKPIYNNIQSVDSRKIENHDKNSIVDIKSDITPVLTKAQKNKELVEQRKIKNALRKAQKEEEQNKLQAMKREQSFKALKYLLNKSVVYTKFLEERFENADLKITSKKKSKDSPMSRNSGKSEISNHEEVPKTTITSPLFENGTLRDYQLEGVEWLKVLFENGLNGILADEMGLGKTVQVIAFICYLYGKNATGPILICAPLSTLPNWVSEFKRFAPKLPVILYHGNKEQRIVLNSSILRKNYVVNDNKNCSPIVLTSFDSPLREANVLASRTWKYIIVDEGHRLKNHKSLLFGILQSFNSINRLLLTGTPLQNNLRELWSLLHFLLPDIFTNFEIFESWLDMEELKNNSEKFIKQEQETQVLSMVHNILKPFVLRRLKTDVALSIPPKKEVVVYCPLSVKQRDLYKYVLEGNMKELNNEQEISILPEKRATKSRFRTYKELSSDEELESEEDEVPKESEKEILTRITMQNRGQMYRKIVNHPYLVHFPIIKGTAKPGQKPELRIDEDLILESGKMMMLDAMTKRLIQTGHKILIFSTLAMMLDIIEEFVLMRGYGYCRLDGSLSLEARQQAMHAFNKDEDIKIFLITTRAGGLGLNLVTADTVILYDSDWNPQADIQAQDRCHRIGQTRPVMVYQFVTRGTIDETIIATGDKKRKLEKLIIQSDKFKFKSKHKDINNKDDLEYLKKLLSEEEKQVVNSVEEVLSPKELDELLDRSELLKQMEQNVNKN